MQNKTFDLDTRTEELRKLVEFWAREKKLLRPDEALEVNVRIISLPKVSVKIEDYRGFTDIDQLGVHDIGLSVRAANCLNNANLCTVGAVRRKTGEEMLKYRNFGKRSLQEIQDKFRSLGIELNWIR